MSYRGSPHVEDDYSEPSTPRTPRTPRNPLHRELSMFERINAGARLHIVQRDADQTTEENVAEGSSRPRHSISRVPENVKKVLTWRDKMASEAERRKEREARAADNAQAYRKKHPAQTKKTRNPIPYKLLFGSHS